MLCSKVLIEQLQISHLICKIFLPIVRISAMDTTQIRSSLVEVLQTIQATSELECPPLSGNTKPLEALPQFDSKIWPVAIGMLSIKLNVQIPPDTNIFTKDGCADALTIDEIVVKVVKITEAQAIETSLKVNER